MTLRGGGGGGVACDANFFLCVLLSYCYYFLPVSQKGPENLLYLRLSWKSFDFPEIATGVATPP